jgi:hypothetical protein
VKPNKRREIYFDLYSKQPGHLDMTEGKNFYCPICTIGFTRDALLVKCLCVSLAHIIPASLGGTWVTLTCSGCNHRNGTELENDLLKYYQIKDWSRGDGSIPVTIGEEKRIRASLTRPESNKMSFRVHTPFDSPHVKKHYDYIGSTEFASGGQFSFSFQTNRPKRTNAAILQSAYLLLFRFFGYDFARLDTYQPYREQILNPDKEIIRHNIATLTDEMGARFEDKQGMIMFVSHPSPFILAMLRYKSPAKKAQYLGVMLPGS